MSRAILVLAVFVAVMLVIFVPLGLIESRQPPRWQVVLGWYLAYTGVSVKEFQRVEVAEAQNPGRFAAHLLNTVSAGRTWAGIDRIPRPEMVQCVRIERQEPTRQTIARLARREYLLIGYHNDGQWRAGWLVHQFRADVSEAEQQAALDKMGCTNWVEIPAQMLHQPSARNSSNVSRTPNAIEIFATQTAPTPTPTAVPTRRSVPTAEPTPHKRHFPPSNAPLPAELAVPRVAESSGRAAGSTLMAVRDRSDVL